jgi:hypothetical protein
VATNRPTSGPTHTRVQVKGTIGKSVRLQQPAADLATLVAQLTPSIQSLIATAAPPTPTGTFVYFQNVIGVPPQVLVAPNRMPQEDTFEDPYLVPGPQGVRGVAGLSLPPLFADDPEDVAIIPGPAGAAGAAGPQGPLGVPLIFEMEQPEDVAIIPGPAGLPGLNGPVGEPGVPVFMPNDFDLEDAVVIPGPQGLRGLPGIQGLPTYIDADDPEYPYNVSGPPAMGANPTGLIGLTAVNGVSLNFTRSDSTHALDQSISPTWTGTHTFSGAGITTSFAGNVTIGTPSSGNALTVNQVSTTPGIVLQGTSSPVMWLKDPGADGSILELKTANGKAIVNSNWFTTATALSLQIDSVEAIGIATTGGVTIAAPSSGDALKVTNVAGANALVLAGNAAGTAVLRLNTQATTGTQTATFTATNKPGSGTTGPDKWIPISLDGTTHYVPAFL